MSAQPTDRNALLTAALAYAELGWAVFPLSPATKKPLAGSRGFKDASNDPEQIRAWWTERPDANIGIATGAVSGISVLDVDEKKWEDKHGNDTLAALTAEYGVLPTTLTQKTWSGGLQIVFAYSPHAAQGAGNYGPDLDGRNDGGYIVAPPSVVQDEAREGTYAWLSDPRSTALAAMPRWLLDRGTATKTHGPRRVANPRTAAAESLLAGVARNNALASLAGTMRDVGFEEEEIYSALAGMNAKSASPLPDHEVRRTARSIARYEPKNDPTEDAGGERYTDATNAARLAEVACHAAGHVGEMRDKWFVFQGGRLGLDFPTAMYRFTNAVAQAILLDASAEQSRAETTAAELETIDSKTTDAELQARAETLWAEYHDHVERGKMLRHAGKHLESAAGARACIEMAKAEPALRIKLDQLDAHPTWLNTPSGTLDLETAELRAHAFTDYLTKITGVAFDPAARCPRWEQFLEDVLPDPEVRSFMQRAVGYALTDLTTEQCMWFLYGKGRNGKSTFLNALRVVLGEYGAAMQASTLMVRAHGDDMRNDVAALRGARFVSATEAEDGQRMAEALIKQMTGGDPMVVRKMYADFFTFTPTYKIFLAANHKPIIQGTDLAIWRRIHLVPFTQTIPESLVDHRLPAALAAEGPGILNWAVEGYRFWRAGGLEPPKAVTDATAEYRAEMDPLADFLEDACFVGPGNQCTAAELYRAYTTWAEGQGIRYPLKARTLGLALQDRGFLQHRGTGGVRSWRGIKPRVV